MTKGHESVLLVRRIELMNLFIRALIHSQLALLSDLAGVQGPGTILFLCGYEMLGGTPTDI